MGSPLLEPAAQVALSYIIKILLKAEIRQHTLKSGLKLSLEELADDEPLLMRHGMRPSLASSCQHMNT